MPESIIIKNTQAPGDYIVLSAALRDIARAYPNKYELIINVPQPDVFRNNPHVLIGGKRRGARSVKAKYNDKRARFGIHKSNQLKAHFLWGFLAGLNYELGIDAKLTEFRPALYLTEEEKRTPMLSLDKPYWVFVSGGKKDYTAKWWSTPWWQEVIDALKDKITMVQVGGGSHIHPAMRNVHDLTKKTSFRELMRLIYHSQGVFCIVTCLMHIAAAFNKPCVTIAGGREPWWWEAYTVENRLTNMRFGNPEWEPPVNDDFIPHQYLHTMDKLSCCTNKGCWKARVGPAGNVCLDQVIQSGVKLPRCMQMITPDQVIDAWRWYFDNDICSLGNKLILPPRIKESIVKAEPKPVIAVPEVAKITVVEVKTRVSLSLYLDETCPNPLERAKEIKNYVNQAKADLIVFYNGFHPELGTMCSQQGIAIHMDLEKPGRSELMRRMLYLAHQNISVWLEHSVRPAGTNWLERLIEPLSGAGYEASGSLRWRKFNQTQIELVKTAPWYKQVEMHQFPYDLSVRKVYYFEPGLFAATTAMLREIGWPDKRLPEAEIDVMFGEALHQLSASIHNVGSLVEAV